MNIQDELERSFGPEPALRPPTDHLYAGRAALRRRRLSAAAAAAATAVVIGGVAWALPGTDGPGPGQELPVVGEPTPDAGPPEIPLSPDDCSVGGRCLSAFSPLAPLPALGTEADLEPFLGFVDGKLVRYRSDFEVLDLIVDPFQTGAVATAAIDLRFEGQRFRALLTEGFGYTNSLVRAGDDRSLAVWFAAQERGMGGCGGQLPESYPSSDEDSNGPGCLVGYDDQGTVVPEPGTRVILRLAEPDLPPAAVREGVDSEALIVEAGGYTWFVLAQSIADGGLFDIDYVPVEDPEASLEDWLAAPEEYETDGGGSAGSAQGSEGRR